MLSLEQWKQTAVFEPANPSQKKIEKYAGIPGAYATYYFNRVPVQGQLKGPFTDGVATGAGIWIGLAVTGLAIGLGYKAYGKLRGKKASSGTSGVRLGGVRLLGGYRTRRRR